MHLDRPFSDGSPCLGCQFDRRGKPEEVVSVFDELDIQQESKRPSPAFVKFFAANIGLIVDMIFDPLVVYPNAFYGRAMTILMSRTTEIESIMAEDDNVLGILVTFPAMAVDSGKWTFFCRLFDHFIFLANTDWLARIPEPVVFFDEILKHIKFFLFSMFFCL